MRRLIAAIVFCCERDAAPGSIVSLNWSAVPLAVSVASPACAAHAVARSQARTRVGCGARRSMARFVAVGMA